MSTIPQKTTFLEVNLASTSSFQQSYILSNTASFKQLIPYYTIFYKYWEKYFYFSFDIDIANRSVRAIYCSALSHLQLVFTILYWGDWQLKPAILHPRSWINFISSVFSILMRNFLSDSLKISNFWSRTPPVCYYENDRLNLLKPIVIRYLSSFAHNFHYHLIIHSYGTSCSIVPYLSSSRLLH